MIKLISLNVERSKHLERNIPFFQEERPDVLNLQEVFEDDLKRFSEDLAMPYFIWIKDALIDEQKSGAKKSGYSGPAIFSRTPFSHSGSEYYYMPAHGIALEGSKEKHPETNAQGILWADINIDGENYRFANTHFTCTALGAFTEKQKSDFEKLRKILDGLGGHILSGDLNVPRGKGGWELFTAYYGQDNIPKDVTSTLDPKLFRTKGVEVVVDGIFVRNPYQVYNLRIVSGLSDHQALVTHIKKTHSEE